MLFSTTITILIKPICQHSSTTPTPPPAASTTTDINKDDNNNSNNNNNDNNNRTTKGNLRVRLAVACFTEGLLTKLDVPRARNVVDERGILVNDCVEHVLSADDVDDETKITMNK